MNVAHDQLAEWLLDCEAASGEQGSNDDEHDLLAQAVEWAKADLSGVDLNPLRARRVAAKLNAGVSQWDALEQVGIDPEDGDVYSEDPCLPFDDPHNDLIDFGWTGNTLTLIRRVAGRWEVQTSTKETP